MIDLILQPFIEYGFMRRALVGCFIMALSSVPIGIFMVLRRMSLTGDAMAHAILPGVATGYIFAGLSLTAMTIGGLLAGLLVALTSGLVTRKTILKEDASLAVFYLISLALGVILVSSGGSQIDLMHLLFGSILALDVEALVFIASIATISLITLAFIYRALVMECLDPHYLRSVCKKCSWVHYIFLMLMVLNLVAGFHALGTLMAVGMMILPSASARFWSNDLFKIIVTAIFIGLISGFIGLLISFYAGMPSGPSIVLALGIIYIISMFLGFEDGGFWRFINRHKHLVN